MPVNNYSVGRDIVLDVVTSTGPIRINRITSFTSKPMYEERKISGLDGVTDNLILPSCWEGSMDVERQDAELDSYFAQLENDYYAGSNITNQTITETISEPDGSVSQYRYEQVVLKLDTAGEWRGDDSVKQSISFMASRRKRVS